MQEAVLRITKECSIFAPEMVTSIGEKKGSRTPFFVSLIL
jgi:hypothetical protein